MTPDFPTLNFKNPPKLGFVGMGLMGTPISVRLLQAGHTLNVWNRNPAKTTSPVQASARHCHSLSELAINSRYYYAVPQ